MSADTLCPHCGLDFAVNIKRADGSVTALTPGLRRKADQEEAALIMAQMIQRKLRRPASEADKWMMIWREVMKKPKGTKV
jgi:hypothetical protein